jgi:hypothetical protein
MQMNSLKIAVISIAEECCVEEDELEVDCYLNL